MRNLDKYMCGSHLLRAEPICRKDWGLSLMFSASVGFAMVNSSLFTGLIGQGRQPIRPGYEDVQAANQAWVRACGPPFLN